MPGKPAHRRLSAAFIFLVLTAAALPAQQATPAVEPSEAALYKMVRQDEDWSYLRHNPGRNPDYLEKVKYIPLRNEEGWYVSLGGDVRERYELLDHPLWGQGQTDTNGYLMQRYLLHADIHLGPRVRVFSQFKSGLINERNGGPRPTDEDKAEFHQAFVDLGIGGKNLLSFRAGRQELSFGTSRLVSIREQPNVRQSFDGLRATLNLPRWRIDGFVTRPVETNPGAFDDSPDHTRTFWGLYAVRPWRVLPGGHLDLYYLGIDRKNARFDQGSAREIRHSAGTML